MFLLFSVRQNLIDFFFWIPLVMFSKAVSYKKSVCGLLWSAWCSTLGIERFLWSFYVLLEYFFLTLEKLLCFFSLASSFFPIHFLDKLYKFKWGICCIIEILAKLPMALGWEYSFGVRMNGAIFSPKCTLEICPSF